MTEKTSPPLPHAIFLDLDDTIIDDSSSVAPGWSAALQEHAGRLAGIELEAFLPLLNSLRDWYWSDAERHRIGRQDLVAASTLLVAETLQRLGYAGDMSVARSIAERYRRFRDEGIALLPGAIEAIESMRSVGVRLALLTNGTLLGQRAKIERFDLARHFDHICIEGELGCGKPDERVYRAALRELGAEPSTTWMVGDNLEWDVAAPMRLGITGIWLDRFAAGLPAGSSVMPSRTILALSELV